ncbi:MAG: DNA mismatch repair endonuclease MutL [Eubacteriales bacterium]|jgi:DNA mismatch repair protein MutL
MGKVHVLSEEVAHLIAAGEVVQRPVSVVKELVENALDAGAKAITVEIQGGGVSFIKVTDNGSGILREDVPVCLLRHATSKIRQKEDLAGIATLGFRGEALAAISSVSRMDIITRAAGEEVGTHASFGGGRELSLAEAGCPVGTTMVVRDLFFNTPARMKFLKKDNTEAGHISDMLERLALSHPGVSFRLLRDGRTVLSTSGNGRVEDCIYSIYGRELLKGLLPVEYEYQNMQVRGFVTAPAHSRSNRNWQSFFLNGRYVKNKNFVFGLEEAYKDSIMTRKYPACILYVTADTGAYDVNVHPEKTEVKFAREKDVYDLIYYACKTALTAGDRRVDASPAMKTPAMVHTDEGEKPVYVRRAASVRSGVDPEKSQQILDFMRSFREEHPSPRHTLRDDGFNLYAHIPPAGESSAETKTVQAHPEPAPLLSEQEIWAGREMSQQIPEPPAMPVEQPVPEVSKREPVAAEEPREPKEPLPWRMVGELFATYILVEQGDKLLMIDKHAAHERILYEQLKQQKQEQAGQLLLEPVTLSLGRREAEFAWEQRQLLAGLGVELEQFGGGTLLVRQVPMGFAGEDIQELVEELLQQVRDNRNRLGVEMEDQLLHTMACKAAIKAGQRNAVPELEVLVRRVVEDGDIRYCPHGRPVCVEMTRYSIEKQFKRIV